MMKYEGETDYMYRVRREAESKKINRAIECRIKLIAECKATADYWLKQLKGGG